MSGKTNAGGEICPDPSVHEHAHKEARLQDSASKAALLATGAAKPSNPLGPDGKLSSAGAAASLKYAQAHELPSFPSVGIDTTTSGNKAAHLANANQKPFEHWKPELSSSASKAALLAHKDGGKLNLWQPSGSEHGLSAAGAAMGIKSSPQLDYGYTEDGRKKALLAATISVSGRAKSPEQPASKLYPDQENASYNALNAASIAHKPSTRGLNYGPMSDPANEASRLVHGTNFNKALYTEHPQVDIEIEEQRYKAALRASSISVAKQMQEVQARKSEDQYYAGLVAEDKSRAARTGSKNTPDNIRAQALGYLNLQDAAQRLAAERLKKLDPDGVLAYREHWGMGAYADQPEDKEKSPRKKSTRHGRFGRDRNLDEDSSDSEADEAEAAKIRNKMRGINAEVASIDAKKRETDRAGLLAAAEKAVKARMATMDDKVFKETGKASPALMAEWEAKAKAKAAANNEERMKNYGKVHIGGGQYMDQAELDAIAQRRMQPTLDEITDTAEKQRARDAEIALDIEQRKRESEQQRQRERETKAELKRVQDEEKQHVKQEKDHEKAQIKQEKEQKKAEAAEIKERQKAQEREEKQREKEEKEVIEAQKRLQKEEAKQMKEVRAMEAKAEKQRQKEEAKFAKAEEKRQRESEETDIKPVAVAGGAAAGATAAGAIATEEDKAQGKSELGEVVADSSATRAAHDGTTEDPVGVPTSFDKDAYVEPSSSTVAAAPAPVATPEPTTTAAPRASKETQETAKTSLDTPTQGSSSPGSPEKDRGSKRRSFFSKFKRAIQDPAARHTPEGQHPTEHQMVAVDYPEKHEDKGKSVAADGGRSPSPDIEALEQERDRKASVESDVFVEARDQPEPGRVLPLTSAGPTESKFHEEV